MSRGLLHIKAVERATGRVLWERNRPNLIVNTGREEMASAGAAFITQAGAGTGTSTPSPDDVAPLTNQHLVDLGSVTAPSARERVFDFTFAGEDMLGLTATEFGLFTAAGALVARWVDSPGWPMRAGVDLVGNWYVTF
jgi:hypothetical protein